MQAKALVADAYASDERFDLARRARMLGEALALYRAIEDRAGQARVLVNLGNTASNVADHVGALDYLHEAQEIADSLSDADLQRRVRGQMMGAHLDLGDLATALHHATIEWESAAGSDDAEIRLNACNGLGCVLVAMGDSGAGIDKLRESMCYIDRIEPPAHKAHMHSQALADLALAHLAQGEAADALRCAQQGAEVAKTIDHAPLVALNQVYAGRASVALGDPALALQTLEPALALARHLGLKTLEIQARYELSSAFGLLGRNVEALDAYRAAHSLEKDAGKDEAFRRTEFLRARTEIALNRREREDAERVLFTVLPKVIATRMRGGEERIADEILDASVLFIDIVGFTALSTCTPPRELLGMLERVFSEFDRLTASFGLEKIKTIGDAYMAVGGALAPTPDHLERAGHLAQAMLKAMERIRVETGTDLAIRIGLHAGAAIAGVIGASRLSYDLWGETVNLASRLESSSLPGRIHVSESVAQRLAGVFAMEPRNALQLKGFGEIRTCFLNPR